jgi:hypothetical protein
MRILKRILELNLKKGNLFDDPEQGGSARNWKT